MLDFYVKTKIKFSLRDKRLFEITDVEITRVDCIWVHLCFFFFFAILTAFVTSSLLLWRMKLFQKKSTLKGKNSVLSEQILRGANSFLKELTHNELKVQMKIKELFPLIVYPFT